MYDVVGIDMHGLVIGRNLANIALGTLSSSDIQCDCAHIINSWHKTRGKKEAVLLV